MYKSSTSNGNGQEKTPSEPGIPGKTEHEPDPKERENDAEDDPLRIREPENRDNDRIEEPSDRNYSNNHSRA